MKKHAARQKSVSEVMKEHGLDFEGRDGKPLSATTIHVFEVPAKNYDTYPVVKGSGRVVDVKKEAEK